MSLIEKFLPQYQFSERHRTTLRCTPGEALNAVMMMSLQPPRDHVAETAMSIRIWPARLLHWISPSRFPSAAPFTVVNFTPLGRDGDREMVGALVAKFWQFWRADFGRWPIAMNDCDAATRRRPALSQTAVIPPILAVWVFALVVAAPAFAQSAMNTDGEAIYRERCVGCHEAGAARAPDLAALRQMSPDRVLASLRSGSMSMQGQGLSNAQLDSLSRFVAAAAVPDTARSNGACAAATASLADALARPHWNGWGADLSQHRFQPAAMAELAAEDVPRLKLKWAFGYPGATRAQAQPTLMGGQVFVGSQSGKVYALDASSGCTHWVFDAGAGVRSAITVAASGDGWSAYFGDQRGNAFAIDAVTGELRWKTHLEAHRAAIVSGAPALAGAVLYIPLSSFEEASGANPRYECCSFRGSVVALDAATGKIVWQSYTIPEAPAPVRTNAVGTQLWGPSGAAIWSSPSVDPDRAMIYVTTGDSYSDPPADTSDAFIAFRMQTGELAWSRQMTSGDAYTVACAGTERTNCPQANGPDLDFGSSPILVDLPDGRRALIAGQKSGVVHAIDPDRQGAILWQRRVGRGGLLGGVQWGSAVDGDNVYVAVSDLSLRLAGEGTPGAQKSIFGPSLAPDPGLGGGMYALKLATGEVVWQTPHPGCHDVPGCSPGQSAAVTAIPGAVFSGGLDGHLRAYAASDGKIIWDVDTARTYTTVNGVAAHGGSLDGPGAVIVGGMLYVNSGYANFGTTPGNVLLAFSIDGR
ncbi:PQQ-binding-like beta-propeller repeat protein [Bradyrhizobium sp.]|uniref:outer membrane protein assembly factor BamB family protein n=1 Tax=Bradyrhizobium sp. TaxID=376 RepID=UPI003C131340